MIRGEGFAMINFSLCHSFSSQRDYIYKIKMSRDVDRITESRSAFKILTGKIQERDL